MSTAGRSLLDRLFLGWIAPVFILWTLLIVVLLVREFRLEERRTRETAQGQARTHLRKDQAFRLWSNSHGGVYVPVDARTQPNPNLADLPERDLVTPSGRQLTLMNPAYMLRQLLEEYADYYGVRGRLTSLKPLRPENAPDPWERAALLAFEKGAVEVSEYTTITGRPYLRLIQPLPTENGCLKCHANQGFREGDVRGGLEVSVDLQPLLRFEQEHKTRALFGLGCIWGLGLTGFGGVAAVARRRTMERDRSEAALRESQRRLSLFFNQSLDGYYFSAMDEPLDWHGRSDKDAMLDYAREHQRIAEANEAILRQYRTDRDKFIGRTLDSFFQHDSVRGRQLHCKLFDEGRLHVETCERRDDGAPVWVEGDYVCVHDDARRIVGTFGIQRDITDRKQAEQALRESEERFSTLFRSNPVPAGIMRIDNSQFIEVNDAFLRLTGFAREEVLGHTAVELGVWPVPAERERAIQLVRERGRISQFEAKFRTKAGEIHDQLFSCEVVVLSGQSYLLGMILDITERKQLENRLRQSQKMEGIGHLAGGMAHEFNNILAAIMMNIGLLRQEDLNLESREMVLEVGALSQRAAALIKQLLAFSRQSVMRVQPLDWAEVVANQIRMLRRVLGERIVIELTAPRYLPRVNADRVMLEQILLNLCLNARDAMADGGRLHLTMRERVVSAAAASEAGEPRAGRFVVLTVSDTGCGMDERTLSRLFEPFFTTKEVGKGTGLGLATVRGIVQQQHGWVEVESVVGRGSTFRVFLPALGDVTEPAAAAPAPAPPAWRSATLLVIEDESSLRQAASKLLTAHRYQVLEAANGHEALLMWKHHHQEIDLVLSDVVIPGPWSGVQLVTQMREEKPGLKVILTSGYTAELPEVDASATSGVLYLPKPCPPETLLASIRECLGPAGG